MNLRLPVLAGVVAIAAGAAAVRAAHRSPEPAPFTAEMSGPLSRHADRSHAAREAHDRIVIYVAGEVQHGGMYTLSSPARAIDAVRAAGGTTGNADLVAVNLAQSLADGDEVAVPALGETRAPAAHHRTSHRAKRSHRKAKSKHRHRRHRRVAAPSELSGVATGEGSDASASGDESDEPATVVDLNTADENELETLPGVGATLAERIVAFRELTGPFASTDDLLDVSGVTQAKLDAIAPYVKAEIRENAP